MPHFAIGERVWRGASIAQAGKGGNDGNAARQRFRLGGLIFFSIPTPAWIQVRFPGYGLIWRYGQPAKPPEKKRCQAGRFGKPLLRLLGASGIPVVSGDVRVDEAGDVG